VYRPDCTGFNMEDVGWYGPYVGNKTCHSCCSNYAYFQEHCADTSAYPPDSERRGMDVTCPATTVVKQGGLESSQGFRAKWPESASNMEKQLPTFLRMCYWDVNQPYSAQNSTLFSKFSAQDVTQDYETFLNNTQAGRYPYCKKARMFPWTERFKRKGQFNLLHLDTMSPSTFHLMMGGETDSFLNVEPDDCVYDCCQSEEYYNANCANVLVRADENRWFEKGNFNYCCGLADDDPTFKLSPTKVKRNVVDMVSSPPRKFTDEENEWGLRIPRHYGDLCKTSNSADLYTGVLPKRFRIDAPFGMQIGLFTTSMHKYQAYCAKNNYLSMPLYDQTADRKPGQPPPAFSEEYVKEWSTRLMNEWLSGDLYLPLTDAKEVPLEGVDYGKGKALCARLPSVVNWVSDCNCQADAQCISYDVHKYTFFFGTRTVMEEKNIRAATALSCSYFRQLEILNETGIDSFHPHSDYTLKATSENPQIGTPKLSRLHLDYDVPLHNHPHVPQPYPLRQTLEQGMIKAWHDGLDQPDQVFKRYFDACQPEECYYDKKQQKDETFYIQYFILAFGGLATILMAGVHGAINGITSVLGMVHKPADCTRKDIYELHFAIAKKLQAAKHQPQGHSKMKHQMTFHTKSYEKVSLQQV